MKPQPVTAEQFTGAVVSALADRDYDGAAWLVRTMALNHPRPASKGATRTLHQYAWYSLCSAHREISPQCPACHAGRWIDEADPEVIADRQLYRDDPDAWRRKHNPANPRLARAIETDDPVMLAWYEN